MQYNITETARHQWQYILPRIGIEPHYLRDKHQPCPLCGGKDRYRFDDKDGNGTYICNQCGAGNGMTMVMKHLHCDFKEAAQIVAQILGIEQGNDATAPTANECSGVSHTPTKQPAPPTTQNQPAHDDNIDRLNAIWHEAKPLQRDCPATQYLHTRGINTDWHTLPNIRCAYLPYWYTDTNDTPQMLGYFNVLIGALTTPTGEIMGIQRVYLQPYQGTFIKARLTHP